MTAMEIRRAVAPGPQDSKVRLPKEPVKMIVTPEMASDWLETRLWGGNRKILPAKVEVWVKVIKSGDWKTTHQGIAFDEMGLIQDGQNRLKAISVAGIPVEVWVFPDMPRENFDAIDTGAGRQAAQFIRDRTPSLTAGALRYISAVTDRDYPSIWRQKLSLHESLELHRQWPETDDWGMTVNVVRQYTRISASPLLAVVSMGQRGGMPPERIGEFLEGLKVGAIGDPNDPRLQLRNRWIRDADALKGAHKRTHVYALIVKAFNLYAKGETQGRLIYTDGDHIPLPHGMTWGGVRIVRPEEPEA